MSITSALYSGISGITANGEAMSVIGNNISNINTTGFKQGRMLFSDMLSSTISGGGQVGRGVQFQTVENQFSQGSFETTESATDLAIQGDPFFALQGSAGRFYSRAGAFHFDNSKVLVNPDGYQVLGYGIIPSTGLSNGVLGGINLTSFATTPPNMTTKLSMVANLDATQLVPGTTTATKTSSMTMAGGTFDPTLVAGSTYTVAAPPTVYDDAGAAHASTLTFTKTAPNIWSWTMGVTGGTPATVTGNLDWTGGGALAPVVTGSPATLTLNGSSQTITPDFSTMRQPVAGPYAAPTATANGAANTAVWNPANPVATSNFSTSISVYDSQGNSHPVTVYFRKTAANNWNWYGITDAVTGTLGSSTNPLSGTLSFLPSGALSAQTPAANTPQNITFAGGVTAPQAMTFDFGGGASTQYASPSIVSSQTQNGYQQGSLVKVSVDDKGYVNGVYSNGQQQKIAQVALARFAAPTGLSKMGGNLFQETLGSGQAQMVDATSPGVGKILSNSLEQSNVDMAAQFVKMITIQRGYSANSKTVTTTDEMLQELINLKR